MSLSTLQPKKKPGEKRRDEGQSPPVNFSAPTDSCSCSSNSHTHSHLHLQPHSQPSSSAPRSAKSSSRSKATRKKSRHCPCHAAQRIIKSNNPFYSTRLSVYSSDELRRFHHHLQLRLMDMHPDIWYDESFPKRLRPLINEPMPELAKYVFTDRGAFYATMVRHINDLKDFKTEVHVIMFKPVPRTVITNDVVWDFNIAPHCRFVYLEVQKTLIMHIAKETRFIEFLPPDQLTHDDSKFGVQGHALGRIKYALNKHLTRMGVTEDEYQLLCNRSRKSEGVRPDPTDPAEYKAIHSCERMFVPRRENPKFDAEGAVWPTMVIETGPAYANSASRNCLLFCVDWWFTQTSGVVKIVLVMYFDYARRETIVEKWVRAEAPLHKELAQTIIINIQPSRGIKNQVVVSDEEGLTLPLEALMGRPKREGEADIVFDKPLLTGFANGYLVPWPNLGPNRRNVLKGSGLKGSKGGNAAETLMAAMARSARGQRNAATAPTSASSLDALKDSLGPALSRVLAADIPRYLGQAGTPQVDVTSSSIQVTLKRTEKPVEKEDGQPEASGQHEVDKEENKKVSVEMPLEKAMELMSTKDKK